MNDDDCQAGGPGMTLLEIISDMTPEQLLVVFEEIRDSLAEARLDRQTAEDFAETMFQTASDFEDKYYRSLDKYRELETAYEAMRKLWTTSSEQKFRYKDALESISKTEAHFWALSLAKKALK